MDTKSSRIEYARQYDAISAEYASLTEIDPAKKFIQYPEALRMLGDIKDRDILDIGCGNGTFTRMLARRGARVIGYDPSLEQIREAQTTEGNEKLGIRYFVADQSAIAPDHTFDKAVAVMVLMYATDREQLQRMFADAHHALKENGSFDAITFNPNFKRLGETAYNRRFRKTNDGRMQVDFLDGKGQAVMSAGFSDFSAADYEQAARAAGFTTIEWEALGITPEGRKAQGNDFWKDFLEDPPYIGLRVSKRSAAET